MTEDAPGTEAQLAPPRDAATERLLAAWRAQGADRCDAVRLRYLESLAARAAGRQGQVRRVLDGKLADAMAAYATLVADRAGTSAPDSAHDRGGAPSAPGPLAALLEHLAAQMPQPQAPAPGATPATAAPAHDGLPELKSISRFRSTWSRLRADRRLQQSQAVLPDNAGPLNSQHLLHRALNLMRTVSPDYLNHFMAYVDGLAGLERVASAQAAAAPTSARTAPARKTARGKGA